MEAQVFITCLSGINSWDWGHELGSLDSLPKVVSASAPPQQIWGDWGLEGGAGGWASCWDARMRNHFCYSVCNRCVFTSAIVWQPQLAQTSGMSIKVPFQTIPAI